MRGIQVFYESPKYYMFFIKPSNNKDFDNVESESHS